MQYIFRKDIGAINLSTNADRQRMNNEADENDREIQ